MRRAIPVAIVLAAALVTGCGSGQQDMTVHGTLEVAVQSYAEFQADYPQAYAGTAQVTVTGPSGNVIGVTTADGSSAAQSAQAETITWGFTVKVPEGLSSYGISVTGGGNTPVQFTQQQMQAGPALCMGDACPQ
jgi:hypothetical protein